MSEGFREGAGTLIRRYAKYVIFLSLVLLHIFGNLAVFIGLGPAALVFGCGACGVWVVLWRWRKTGRDWRVLEKAFEDTMVRMVEPEGVAVAVLAMRVRHRKLLVKKIRAALREIAAQDPERANVLVIVAMPLETLYAPWRHELEHRLERVKVNGVECVHFGPSCSADLEPFRTQGIGRQGAAVGQQIIVERVMEPVDAVLRPMSVEARG